MGSPIPDVEVEGEPTRISWRRWLFEHAHASTLKPAPIAWRELSDLAPYGLLEHHGAGFQPVVLRVPGLPAVPREAGPAADAQYARR